MRRPHRPRSPPAAPGSEPRTHAHYLLELMYDRLEPLGRFYQLRHARVEAQRERIGP